MKADMSLDRLRIKWKTPSDSFYLYFPQSGKRQQKWYVGTYACHETCKKVFAVRLSTEYSQKIRFAGIFLEVYNYHKGHRYFASTHEKDFKTEVLFNEWTKEMLSITVSIDWLNA